jgi:hypothetical protein
MSRGAFLLLPFACLAASMARAADDPMVGDWKLNPQMSTLVDEMKVASLGGNQYSFDFGAGTTEKIVADGTDQPGILGTTLAVSANAPDQWMVVRKKDARVLIVGIWTIAKDDTLHDNYNEFDGNGKTTTHLDYVYDRHGGGSGFAADWVSDNQHPEASYVLEVRPFEGDGLSIVAASQGVTKNVKFDGREYPNPGSRNNIVSSAERVNARAITVTDKIGDKVLDTQEILVSEDGKTLTVKRRRPQQSEPVVLVFDRQEP